MLIAPEGLKAITQASKGTLDTSYRSYHLACSRWQQRCLNSQDGTVPTKPVAFKLLFSHFFLAC